jgi:hypothetical protein
MAMVVRLSDRRNGWPPDPNGKPADQTYQPVKQLSQSQVVTNLIAGGLGIFGTDWLYQRQVFPGSTFDLSYQLFPVPPGGVAIFEVSLQIRYGIQDGNNDSYVLANFFDRIFCPSVQLQVLAQS